MGKKNITTWPDGCRQTGRFLCEMSNLQRIISLSIICLCFICCFGMLIYGIEQEKLKEKFVDIQSFLELTSLHISTYENVDILKTDIEYIDNMPHVFASLYDADLTILTIRTPEEGTAPFDPRINSEFLELVNNNSVGNITISWEDLPGGITRRIMHTCFRWVQLPDDGSYLMAAGISTYSLISPSLNLFIGIILGILFFSIILVLGFVFYVIRDLYIRYRNVKK